MSAPDAKRRPVATGGAHEISLAAEDKVTTTLSTAITSALVEHEKVIEAGLDTFVSVGNALLAIKADKLYLEAGYSTFEDYCSRRWNITRSYGHRLVVAATTVQALAAALPEMLPMGNIPLPEAERQVRPLAVVKDSAERAEVWAAAVADAGGGRPTARQVEQAVARTTRLQKNVVVQNVLVEADDLFANDAERSDAFAMADASDEQFEDALDAARAAGDLSSENVVRQINKRRLTRQQRFDTVERIVGTLESIAMVIDDLDGRLPDLDEHQRRQWAESMRASLVKITWLKRELGWGTAVRCE